MILIVVNFLITCRKIEKYHVRLNGIWYSPKTACSELMIIDESGNGEHVAGSPFKGCNTRGKGKVRFTKNKFYFGNTGFEIIASPSAISSIDSIIPPLRYNYDKKKYKILGEMKIKETFLNGGETKTYYKYIEY